MAKTKKSDIIVEDGGITHEQIDGTPFTVVGQDGKFWGAVAKYRVTDTHDSKFTVIKELKTVNWDNIVKLVAVMLMQNKEIEKMFKDANTKK